MSKREASDSRWSFSHRLTELVATLLLGRGCRRGLMGGELRGAGEGIWR